MDGFEAFVRSRSAALARTAYLLTGDRHAAEDLLQEALARVAERWTAIVRNGEPEPYVRQVLYRRSVDAWRARRWREVVRRDDAPELAVPGDTAEAVAQRVVLHNALGRLTPRQRAVLVLRFYDDRTERETAEILGCSVNTVKSQARHAISRLKELMPDLAETFALTGGDHD